MPNRSVERHEGDGPLERSISASFARWIEQQLGRSPAFVLTILPVVLWDAKALQLKLVELIRVNQAAPNSLISLEENPDLKSRKSNRQSSSLSRRAS